MAKHSPIMNSTPVLPHTPGVDNHYAGSSAGLLHVPYPVGSSTAPYQSRTLESRVFKSPRHIPHRQIVELDDDLQGKSSLAATSTERGAPRLSSGKLLAPKVLELERQILELKLHDLELKGRMLALGLRNGAVTSVREENACTSLYDQTVKNIYAQHQTGGSPLAESDLELGPPEESDIEESLKAGRSNGGWQANLTRMINLQLEEECVADRVKVKHLVDCLTKERMDRECVLRRR